MTSLTEADGYVRVRLFGKLICASDLHIGTGDLEPFEERFDPDDREKIQGGYNSVCLDVRNRPYLPGSTLRGFLRALAVRHDQDLAHDLFGFADKDNKGQFGCASMTLS